MVKIMHTTFQELNIIQKFLSNRVDYDYFKKVIQKTYVMEHEVLAHWEKFQSNQVGFLTSLGNVGQDLYTQVILDIDRMKYNG